MDRIKGLIAAPPTPFNKDGSINLSNVKPLAEILIRNNVTGAFVAGTTGESMSLTDIERMDLVSEWKEQCGEKLKIIFHIGHSSIESCRLYAKHAKDIGADAVAMMAPIFFKPETIDDLIDFCREAAQAAGGLKFFYYHIPSMTGVNFSMYEFMQKASGKIPNFAGMKYTYENLADFKQCLDIDNGRYDVLFGRDEMLLAGLAMGSRGAVGSTYNIAAPLYLQIMEAFASGNMEKAKELQSKSIEMIKAIQKPPCAFLAALKEVMKMIGTDCGPIRKPGRNINTSHASQLRKDLDKIGFFDFCCK